VQDSMTYFTSADGYVYAASTKGNILWKFKAKTSFSNGVALTTERIYAMDRSGRVYSIHRQSGQLDWDFSSPSNTNRGDFVSWHYHDAAPIIYKNGIIIPSPDGSIYALNNSGKVLWRFQTMGRIAATPLIHQRILYVPSNDGHLYKLHADTGSLLGKFKTVGASLNSIESGWDRIGIYTSPVIEGNNLLIGSRDGNLYCLDAETMQEKWRFSYGTSWCMSVAVDNGIVYTGWSDNKCVAAFDITLGKELWKTTVGSLVFTTPLILEKFIVVGSADHTLYWLDKVSGNVSTTYSLRGSTYSNPVWHDNHLYVGCDAGIVYALKESIVPRLAVYQPEPSGNLLPFTVDEKIAPYLVERGFQQLNTTNALHQFLTDRIEDKLPSSIVFAYCHLPREVITENKVKAYLENGGKVVWLGGIVNLHQFDSTNQYLGVDITVGSELLNIAYQSPIESGAYPSKATQEGLNIGLPAASKMVYGNVLEQDVKALAHDEFNRITAWYKRYSSVMQSGFYNLRSWGYHEPIQPSDLALIYQFATYGLK
jgi:outer membrane protein assembly factor BamB